MKGKLGLELPVTTSVLGTTHWYLEPRAPHMYKGEVGHPPNSPSFDFVR